MPPPARSWWRRSWLYLLLFVLTVGSTYLTHGPWYSVGIMSILLAHELGHYLACRHYHVPATLPFFIPMPLTIFGTMGAVIRMRGRIPNRRVLFDVAVAGPVAGVVLALPAVAFGLRMSQVVELSGAQPGVFKLGDSLIFQFLTSRIVGPIAEGKDLMLHPLAFAGWAGLFVTALNLLPVGQLDGGHIVYGLLGRRSLWVSIVALAVFTYVCLFHYPGWAVLIALILLFGFRHPPPMDDATPLGRRRRVIGVAMLIFFVLSFTPVPIKI